MILSVIDIYFKSLAESFSKLYPLEAIWLHTPYKMGPKNVNRLAVDDLIQLEDGKLKGWDDWPTHRITKVSGTLSNNILQIEGENLITHTIETITL